MQKYLSAIISNYWPDEKQIHKAKESLLGYSEKKVI
jgi:hypothetical protein